MSATVAVETRTGAQLLPRSLDERLTMTPWQAHQACDADHRTKHSVFRDAAARITITNGGARD